MEIYIKGLDMPKSCPCELVGIGYDLYCSFTGGNPSRVEEYYECCNNGSRPDWCPLVEVPPHGALKDADKLRKYWLDIEARIGGDTPIESLTLHDVITEGCVFDLDTAPTIIPADPPTPEDLRKERTP